MLEGSAFCVGANSELGPFQQGNAFILTCIVDASGRACGMNGITAHCCLYEKAVIRAVPRLLSVPMLWPADDVNKVAD